METINAFHKEFIDQCVLHMHESTPRIEKCLLQMSDSDVWQRPNENSNSAGNLILHLCGNMTQYIISGMGGAPDERNRDSEFAARGGFTRDALLSKMKATEQAAVDVLQRLTPDDLLKTYSVQGFQRTGMHICIHVVEHYSYHTGQLAFWTKQLKGKDLGFYEGVDLNRRNF